MKKKSKKLLICFIIIAILIISFIVTILFIKAKKDLVEILSTTLEDRKYWSDFLKKNNYLSEIEEFGDMTTDKTDLIKVALSSKDVELEYINTEEIEKNPVFTIGDGYKKSKDSINNFISKMFGIDNISYNFIETYIKDKSYLIINDDYVYFTKLNLKEKEYILADLKKTNDQYIAYIYEYDVSNDNKEILNEMLETGKINKNVPISKKYTIEGNIDKNNNICISKKNIK